MRISSDPQFKIGGRAMLIVRKAAGNHPPPARVNYDFERKSLEFFPKKKRKRIKCVEERYTESNVEEHKKRNKETRDER